MRRLIPFAALPLAFAVPLAAQEQPATPDSVVAAAAPEEWVEIAADDLLVMELAPDAEGHARRVVIQLMPAPFSQPWVENIRTLARAHWWDGTSVYRVVDNWVVQWGGGDPELGMDPGPMPDGVEAPVGSYESRGTLGPMRSGRPSALLDGPIGGWTALLEDSDYGEEWRMRDSYSPWVDFLYGWPVGMDLDAPTSEGTAFPIHCYGSVGVARDLAPDTGTGSELYAVIGHAPRQLDRNIAVVGRVIDGMEYLSTLKRGTGDAGVYESRAEDTPIVSVRLGSEVEEFPPPRYEYFDTESESFARYLDVRANRNDAFYTVPAGGVDICNVQVPIRQIAGD
jgi:peptidylprolyl isomerase